MKKTTKIFLLFFFASIGSIAQTDSLDYYYKPEYSEEYPTDEEYLTEELEVEKFDRDEWKKLTEDIDYSEKKIKEKKKKEPQEFNPEGVAAIGKFLMYLVIAIGVGAIIFIISKLITEGNFSFKKNRKIKAGSVTYDLDEIEENLPDVELKTPIEKAIADGNYPLAIRLYYLSIIQELSANEIITWKREKTNFEYIREMRTHRLGNDFRNVTQIFERVWYGENEIDEAAFLQIQPAFLELAKEAKRVGKAISGK